jgi:hypothetical protein
MGSQGGEACAHVNDALRLSRAGFEGTVLYGLGAVQRVSVHANDVAAYMSGLVDPEIHRANCTREPIPSLAKILERWLSTVR